MTEEQSKKVFAELLKLSGREFARTWDEVRDDLRKRIAMTQDELRAEYDEKLARSRDELRGEIAATGDELRADLRHLWVFTEGLRGDIQMVAEGLISLRQSLGEQIEANRREMAAELEEIKSLLRLSYRDLDRRVTLLEETVPV